MRISALRERLALAIESVVDDRVTVYRNSVDGLAGFPAVVLGMPSWRPLNGCLGIWEFPVAAVVARRGISDATTASALDDLWPVVLEGLLVLRDRQEITDVLRAEFGMFNVQGTDYPAQVLTCSITSS